MKEKLLGYAVLLGIGFWGVLGCKMNVKKTSLQVSFEPIYYTSDVVHRDTLGNPELFPFDSVEAEFYFDFLDTLVGITPVCHVDSIHVTFFNRFTGNQIIFTKSDGTDTLPTLKFNMDFNLNPGETFTTELPSVPSWLKAFYEPLVGMWSVGDPDLLKTKALFEIYAHEIHTGQEFYHQSSVSIDITDYADPE